MKKFPRLLILLTLLVLGCAQTAPYNLPPAAPGSYHISLYDAKGQPAGDYVVTSYSEDPVTPTIRFTVNGVPKESHDYEVEQAK